MPYISSESDNSDSENDKRTDSNNNDAVSSSNSKKDESCATSSTATVSPLALKNSTLTSLLTSSPKNGAVSSKCASPVMANGNGDAETPSSSYQNGVGGSQVKRGFIPFSLFNRNKKKLEQRNEMTTKRGYDGKEDDSKIKAKQAGIATMYPAKQSQSQNNPREETNGKSKAMTNGDGNQAKNNHLTNGVNGETTTSNGWVVTDMEEKRNSEVNDSVDRLNGYKTKDERFTTPKRNGRPVS